MLIVWKNSWIWTNHHQNLTCCSLSQWLSLSTQQQKLPGWAGTSRNTRPPTILLIIQSWSASSSTTIHSILLVQIKTPIEINSTGIMQHSFQQIWITTYRTSSVMSACHQWLLLLYISWQISCNMVICNSSIAATDWVLSHWPISLRLDSFLCMYCMHVYACNMVRWTW